MPMTNQRRNLRSRLNRRRRQRPAMQAYDTLPPQLRKWLANACLPWSPNSALKIWKAAGGAKAPADALARLNAIEQAMLLRDARIWEE
nr:DUF6525 family protein [Ruegeria arenilitoris]